MDVLNPKSINPTDRKIVKKSICIDSLFRKNYSTTSSSDFVYVLPEPINKVTALSISSIEIPYYWYTFSEKNDSNTFTVTLYNCPTPFDLSDNYPPVIVNKITIPPGNYRSDLLTTLMNNMFSNMRNGMEYISFFIDEQNTKTSFRTKWVGDDYTANMNALPGQVFPQMLYPYVVDPSMNSDFFFEVDFRPESDPTRPLYFNAGWMLGFRKPFYTVRYKDPPYLDMHTNPYVIYPYYWYLIGESSYGSSLYNYVFVEVDDFNKNFSTNNFYSPTTNENYLGNNIIGRISLTSGINTIATSSLADFSFKVREYFGPVRIDKIRIRLLDKFGHPIDLIGNDYSFMLEVDQIYSS